MNYLNAPPVQMNLKTAAQYCCVSINAFNKYYRPKLTELEEGGNIYFLKTEIDRFINQRFQEKALWASQKKAAGKPKRSPKPRPQPNTDPFEAALRETGY